MSGLGGVIETLNTGTGFTVSVAVPDLPSLVAVIVAVPSAFAVASPVASTVATVVLLEPHVTSLPVSVFPCASFVVAVNCLVCVTRTVAVGGATVTDATGMYTVIADVPLLPSLLAVIVAVPNATAVTSPDDETVATLVLLDPQLTVRPVSTLPTESSVIAVSCAVVPGAMLSLGGCTTTIATGTGVTVIVLVPLLPSLVAVIVAVPGAPAVTTPVAPTGGAAVTVAAAVLLEPHVTTRSVTTFPAESVTVVVSGKVCVDSIAFVAGETTTLATGIAVTLTVAVPLLPSLVAVIVAVPIATPVTTPAFTVAIALLLDDQVIGRFVTTLPSESFTVAVSVAVLVVRTLTDAGDNVTLATGTWLTVTVVVPDFPSLVAVMTTTPGDTPVTIPVEETTAWVVLLDDQVTRRSVTMLPLTSRTMALS